MFKILSIMFLAAGLMASVPLISNVQAETLNQGRIILSDDQGTPCNRPVNTIFSGNCD